jgi:hypothetical protein
VEDAKLHLDQILERIEGAFGAPPPLTSPAVAAQDAAVMERIFADDGYQDYLQDQVNRQVIRSYLANAIVLGFLREAQLDVFAEHLATSEARAALSLHMVMSSVEDADALVPGDSLEVLEPLRPAPDGHPHMKLVPN